MFANNPYWFDVRSSGFKPEKKQFKIFFFKFTGKFSIDYCDQSSSGNLYTKLLTSKIKKHFFINNLKTNLFVHKE